MQGTHIDLWVIKRMLNTGVYGLMLPHLNTVEDAQAAVVAARYPRVPGVADFEPAGQRGWSRVACCCHGQIQAIANAQRPT
ncbi:MAG TPA: hypothetical protein VNP04_04380 [Alphaproteobacteria bacterium]|nr:hypothetical protein [Alphaproteobacteria bacterium]